MQARQEELCQVSLYLSPHTVIVRDHLQRPIKQLVVLSNEQEVFPLYPVFCLERKCSSIILWPGSLLITQEPKTEHTERVYIHRLRRLRRMVPVMMLWRSPWH